MMLSWCFQLDCLYLPSEASFFFFFFKGQDCSVLLTLADPVFTLCFWRHLGEILIYQCNPHSKLCAEFRGDQQELLSWHSSGNIIMGFQSGGSMHWCSLGIHDWNTVEWGWRVVGGKPSSDVGRGWISAGGASKGCLWKEIPGIRTSWTHTSAKKSDTEDIECLLHDWHYAQGSEHLISNLITILQTKCYYDSWC